MLQINTLVIASLFLLLSTTGCKGGFETVSPKSGDAVSGGGSNLDNAAPVENESEMTDETDVTDQTDDTTTDTPDTATVDINLKPGDFVFSDEDQNVEGDWVSECEDRGAASMISINKNIGGKDYLAVYQYSDYLDASLGPCHPDNLRYIDIMVFDITYHETATLSSGLKVYKVNFTEDLSLAHSVYIRNATGNGKVLVGSTICQTPAEFGDYVYPTESCLSSAQMNSVVPLSTVFVRGIDQEDNEFLHMGDRTEASQMLAITKLDSFLRFKAETIGQCQISLTDDVTSEVVYEIEFATEKTCSDFLKSVQRVRGLTVDGKHFESELIDAEYSSSVVYSSVDAGN